jgi:hypothetical protein
MRVKCGTGEVGAGPQGRGSDQDVHVTIRVQKLHQNVLLSESRRGCVIIDDHRIHEADGHHVVQDFSNYSHHLVHHHHTAGPDDSFLERPLLPTLMSTLELHEHWQYRCSDVTGATLDIQEDLRSISGDLNGSGHT